MNSNSATRTYCPDCELKSIMGKITHETIMNIVSRMAYQQDVTTEPDEYSKRLEVCKGCTSLRNDIMCSECGSYVAFRARLKTAKCPFPGSNKWKEI